MFGFHLTRLPKLPINSLMIRISAEEYLLFFATILPFMLNSSKTYQFYLDWNNEMVLVMCRSHQIIVPIHSTQARYNHLMQHIKYSKKIIIYFIVNVKRVSDVVRCLSSALWLWFVFHCVPSDLFSPSFTAAHCLYSIHNIHRKSQSNGNRSAWWAFVLIPSPLRTMLWIILYVFVALRH